MGNKLYEEHDIQSIANAIRSKGVSGTMKVSQMASKVLAIPTGGGDGNIKVFERTFTWTRKTGTIVLLSAAEMGNFYKTDLGAYIKILVSLQIMPPQVSSGTAMITASQIEYPYIYAPNGTFYSGYGKYITATATTTSTANRTTAITASSVRHLALRTDAASSSANGITIQASSTYPLNGTYKLTALFIIDETYVSF